MHVPSPHDPFRPVDWRARRCEYLIEQRKRPSRRDDPVTGDAWKFFRALARSADERQRHRVRCRWPHLAAALDLRKAPDDFRRWDLEARLLSREPVGVIAGRFGLAAEAVEAYAAVYFDVLIHVPADGVWFTGRR